MTTNPKALAAAAAGKDPLDYLEPALDGPLARVMKSGADKYGYRNYTSSEMKLRTYIASTRRHLNAVAAGEDIDPDSGELHWVHIAANAAVVVGSYAAGTMVDDCGAYVTERSNAVHVNGDMAAKAGA